MQELLMFMAHYDSEAKCRQFMFQLRWPDGFVCTQCGNDEYCFVQTRNLYQCMMCRHQVSLTSGTMFHNTKLPVSYWLFVFHWFASGGEHCSARKLSALLQIHYRTALRMLNIVRQTMKEWSCGSPMMSGDIRWEMAQPSNAVAATSEEVAVNKEKTAEVPSIRIGDASAGLADIREDLGPERVVSATDTEAVTASGALVKEREVDAELAGSVVLPVEEAEGLMIGVDGVRTIDNREEKKVWRPRLLEAYRTGIVAEALGMAKSSARKQISMLYRNVRNWQRYYDEYHFRMSYPAGRASSRRKRAAELLNIAADGYRYAG
ncbi:transposase [Paenibacillus kobensis]|uniref:transposase n=1 Tax=Paenibacillus kobensis TaxID=59841 RepID=UPI000FDAAC5D|nr:transposase [Paenibacillus kobensis]